MDDYQQVLGIVADRLESAGIAYVRSIIEFQSLDDDYVSSWADKLGVASLLAEVRAP